MAASAALVIYTGFSIWARGQEHTPVVEDWSHHAVIFSKPSTPKPGDKKAEEKYSKIVNSTRYKQQELRRSIGTKEFLRAPDGSVKRMKDVYSQHGILSDSYWNTPAEPSWWNKRQHGPSNESKKDWAEPLITGGTIQPNVSPIKITQSVTTADCSNDYAIYPTGVAGSSTKASIVGYDELYEGCYLTNTSVTVPTLSWAYNTGGTVTSSAVGSSDSTQIMYVQYKGGVSYLVLLKWEAGTGSLTKPATPTLVTAANYRSCKAPCYATLNLGASDTYSTPYYDYDNSIDTAYVGDDNGQLHEITGGFTGTPAIDANSGWPLTLNSSYPLATPVYDSATSTVFVGDTGANFYAVSVASTPSITAQASLGGSGAAIMDSPVLDSNAGMVYTFVSNDSSGYNGVFQFPVSVTSGSTWSYSEARVGVGASEYWIYAGNFDNVYYSSSSGNAGNLWVVGNTADGTNGGALYAIPILSSGAMTSGIITPAVSKLTAGYYPWPSPVTEFCNPNSTSTSCTVSNGETTSGIDYLFFSVYSASTDSCTTGEGCILAYRVNIPSSPELVGSQAATVPNGGCWATGGFIIDNSVPSSTLAGTSNAYTFELNGNEAGGPLGYTSSHCATSMQNAVPYAWQALQSNP
jgi:hypothetical protein